MSDDRFDFLSDRGRRLLLLGMIGVYLTFCFILLPRPGLEYDEVLYGEAALGVRTGSYVTYEWNLGGLKVPVMLMTYIGAVRAWLYAPIFAVFGISPWTVRLPMVALGVVTLLCVERFARAMFGQRVALLATALLAVDPSFVFGTREDNGFISIMLTTKTASLALLASFAATRRIIHLFLAFLLLGVGLFDKFNFAWHLGAIGVASIVVWREILPLLTRRNIGIATLGFLAGCWPLLIYNVTSGGGTLSGVEPEPSLPDAFLAKVTAIRATLDGTAFPGSALGVPPESSVFLPWALMLSMAAGIAARRRLVWRWFLFCWCVIVLIAAAIAVTPKATGGHHAMMLWPFLHVVIGAALLAFTDMSREWSGWRAGLRAVAPMTVVILFLTSISFNIRTLVAFKKSGGHGLWSDAIYELAATISRDTSHQYLFMDWGMFNQVLLLSGGKVRQQELFYALSEPGREAAQLAFLHDRVREPENRFVFMAPSSALSPRPRRVFEMVLETHGFREEVLRQFQERDGREIYRIVRVLPDPSKPKSTTLVTASDRGWLRAKRVQGGCVSGSAIFTLEWNAPGAKETEVHVSSPEGPLFSRSGPAGIETTGQWVTSGMTFYLQDTTRGRSKGDGSTIAKIQTDFVCP